MLMRTGISFTLQVAAKKWVDHQKECKGDLLAMVMYMYRIAVIPLIYRVEDRVNKQVLFDDNATAGGYLTQLKIW